MLFPTNRKLQLVDELLADLIAFLINEAIELAYTLEWVDNINWHDLYWITGVDCL